MKIVPYLLTLLPAASGGAAAPNPPQWPGDLPNLSTFMALDEFDVLAQAPAAKKPQPTKRAKARDEAPNVLFIAIDDMNDRPIASDGVDRK